MTPLADFCGKCGASIPPREGEGTCAEGCVPHTPRLRTSYEMYGVECKAGWKGLYGPLLDLCQLYGITVLQVKEKFGGLRFYVGGPRAGELDALIAAAESASLHTCEDCGENGSTYVPADPDAAIDGTTALWGKTIPKATTGPSETSRWIRTLCAPCRVAWDTRRTATDAEAKAAADKVFTERAELLKKLADK